MLDRSLCRVNYKDPEKTPPCAEYHIKKWDYKDGMVVEAYKRFNQTFQTKTYDSDGNLLFYADYKDGDAFKEYYADGTIKKEWFQDERGRLMKIREYDQQGKLIKEY